MGKKPKGQAREMSRSAKTLADLIKEKRFFTNKVAEAAGVKPESLYQMLSGRSRRIKRPETVAQLADVLEVERDPVFFPELRRSTGLSPASKWLFDRLAETGMSRKDLLARIREQAEREGAKVTWSRSALDKVLAGDRPFPVRNPALVRLLGQVLGEVPPDDTVRVDALDLQGANLLVHARAVYMVRGEIAPGALSEVGAMLHRRDTLFREQEMELAGGNLPVSAKLRYRAIDAALQLFAEGKVTGIQDFGLPARDHVALSLLLMGMERPADKAALVENLAKALDVVAPSVEATDKVARPFKRFRIRLAPKEPPKGP